MFTRNSQLILRRLTFNPLTRQCKYNSQSSEAGKLCLQFQNIK